MQMGSEHDVQLVLFTDDVEPPCKCAVMNVDGAAP